MKYATAAVQWRCIYFHFLCTSPILWVLRSVSPEVKRLGREADHSLPSTTEVRNKWSYNPTPSFDIVTSVPTSLLLSCSLRMNC